ncbi:unnamed protein product, partial [Mesorhabditis belari]|uniref:Origin recognition complex subunit 4 n=1 Tax=Mesorhabditis belari TaxID=2138241 RepID=A0AAF3EAU7_9BILA
MLDDADRLLNEVTSHIDSKLVGLDENISRLEQLFARFLKDGQGESIVIAGPRQSGRSTAIEKALNKTPGNKKVVVMDVWLMGAEARKLNNFLDSQASEDEENSPVGRKSKGRTAKTKSAINKNVEKTIIVVRGVDELVARSKQALLYRLLNATRTQPWLVLLIVNRQDFVMSLEKRIRSRISSKKMQFGSMTNFDVYFRSCGELLGPLLKRKSWKMEKVLSDKNIKALFKGLFQIDPSVIRLKSILSIWVENILSNPDLNVQQQADFLDNAIKFSLEINSRLLPNILALSTRTHALILCILRRARYQMDDGRISYWRIITDYKQMCKAASNDRLSVTNDVELYKELDQLCELRIIDVTAERGCTNLEYKRATLSCCPSALEKELEACDIPTDIKKWAEGQPTN